MSFPFNSLTLSLCLRLTSNTLPASQWSSLCGLLCCRLWTEDGTHASSVCWRPAKSCRVTREPNCLTCFPVLCEINMCLYLVSFFLFICHCDKDIIIKFIMKLVFLPEGSYQQNDDTHFRIRIVYFKWSLSNLHPIVMQQCRMNIRMLNQGILKSNEQISSFTCETHQRYTSAIYYRLYSSHYLVAFLETSIDFISIYSIKNPSKVCYFFYCICICVKCRKRNLI